MILTQITNQSLSRFLLLFQQTLTRTVGQIIGTGTGRGIALMFIILGGLSIFITVAIYQYVPLRFLEKKLPNEYSS